MKLRILAVATLVAFGGAVYAQAPAPGTIKADRAAVKADAQAVKADREKLKADRAARVTGRETGRRLHRQDRERIRISGLSVHTAKAAGTCCAKPHPTT